MQKSEMSPFLQKADSMKKYIHFSATLLLLPFWLTMTSCKKTSKNSSPTVSNPPDATPTPGSGTRSDESIVAVVTPTPTPTATPTVTPVPTPQNQVTTSILGRSFVQSPYAYAAHIQILAAQNSSFVNGLLTTSGVVTGWDQPTTASVPLSASAEVTSTMASPVTLSGTASGTTPQVVQQDPIQRTAFVVATPYSRWQVGKPFFTSQVKVGEETLDGLLFFSEDARALNGNAVSSYFDSPVPLLQWHSIVSEPGVGVASASTFPCKKSALSDVNDTVLGVFNQSNLMLHLTSFGVQLPSQMWAFSAQNRCAFQGSLVIPKGKYIKRLEQVLRASAAKDTGASGLVTANINFFNNALTLNTVSVTFVGANQYAHGRAIEESVFGDMPRNLQDWQCGYTHANALQTDFRLEINASGSHIPFVNNFIMGAREDDVRYTLKPELANCL